MDSSKEFNIFITGTSGLIGSHVLYEVLNSIHNQKYKAKIFILLRSKKNIPIQKRLQFMFNQNFIPEFLRKYQTSELLKKINIIEGDLRDKDLSYKLKQIIPNDKKLYILHIAAVTNLFSNKNAKLEVYQNNYLATKKWTTFVVSARGMVRTLVTRFSFILHRLSRGMCAKRISLHDMGEGSL